jgi:hypothetical protein
MANVTIALEDSLIVEGRKLAERRSTTLNGMLRGFLERSLKQEGSAWLDSLFAEVDGSRAKARRPRSEGERDWSRDELYDV